MGRKKIGLDKKKEERKKTPMKGEWRKKRDKMHKVKLKEEK